MPELIPEPDSTGVESQTRKKSFSFNFIIDYTVTILIIVCFKNVCGLKNFVHNHKYRFS
jgi:hypothetical protein